MNTLLEESIKYIFLDLIGNILYFPIWWYTKGAKNVLIFCFNQIKEVEEYLALFVWIRNIFTPMYAQYDWQGRIISFFIRVFQIFFRSIFLLTWSVLCLILFLIWLVIPLFVGYQIYRNII